MALLSRFAVSLAFFAIVSVLAQAASPPCDTVQHGYVCDPDISHNWGQYSPYYSVPSEISNRVPKKCSVTFAQILSRHGARDPTASKTAVYRNLTTKIKSRVKTFKGKYSFLADYNYTLGADQLTTFGQQELVNSGIKFFRRYSELAKHVTPFVRSSSEARVVESAKNWTQGFHKAFLEAKGHGVDAYPYGITVISEADGSNNTLNHDLCTAFEDGPDSKIGNDAQAKWVAVFVPPIQARLNADLPGVNLTATDVISFMDLCPFNTVASNGTISPFCGLFTDSEWKSYDYYESLGKYYGYGNGNPLGPTQGVGFVNELIARLTNTPVVDSTSTNRTLDSNPATFPLGGSHVLFADFSHDNDMTAIFAALGLYNRTKPLANTSVETTAQTQGYSASWTVPFAARAYFEKLRCDGVSEELVRVIVNDRVIPLPGCNGDAGGMCLLGSFVKSLSFARGNGLWNQCFSK